MSEFSTTLSAVLDRIVDTLVDAIAKDGLVALKRVLDEAGFGESEYLKNYEVYARVRGDTVTFEIVLDFEAVVGEDKVTQDALEEDSAEDPDGEGTTYGLGPAGPQRILSSSNALRDARRPARDARRPLRNAATTSRDRLIAKEVANVSPRSARVTRDGRLTVALLRSTKTVDGETVIPQGKFQGIIGKFMKELQAVVASRFAPEISAIVARYA